MKHAQVRARALQLVLELNRNPETPARPIVDDLIAREWDLETILQPKSIQDRLAYVRLRLLLFPSMRRELLKKLRQKVPGAESAEVREAHKALKGKRAAPTGRLDAGLRYLRQVLLRRPEELEPLMRCDRCKKYFLDKTGREDRRFCSPSCARSDSATRAVAKRRAMQHALRIQKVREAAEAYDRLRRKPRDWKRWVAKRAGLGITPKWITRNRRDLSPNLPWESGI